MGDMEDAHALAMRTYAQEPYYVDLLSVPREQIGDATLADLMQAWTVLVRAINVVRDEFPNVDHDETPAPHVWAHQFVPVLQTNALAQGISNAMGIEYRRALKILHFFVFRGEAGQDLYSQPLVPVGEGTVAPCCAATYAPNLRRLVDVWLRQLGGDLEERGTAFEEYVRLETQRMIEGSPVLLAAQSTKRPFVLRVQGKRDEEIDVILVIGELVIVGEAKCMLQPSDAKGVAFHRKHVADAAAQVRRKAASVEANLAQFRDQLAQVGIEVPEKAIVLPLVILNNAVHAGYAVEDVSIADMYILEVFFSGELLALQMQHPDGTIETLERRVLYTDTADAIAKAADYFASPPQLDVFKRAVERRPMPVHAIDETDWQGIYWSIDCSVQIDREHVSSSRNPNEINSGSTQPQSLVAS
jgi:hypothetical protein